MCYGDGVLPLVISHSRQGTICYGHGVAASCDIRYHTADRGYDLLQASCASCGISRQKGDTICYGHWVLHSVISYSRQEVRFDTVVRFCLL